MSRVFVTSHAVRGADAFGPRALDMRARHPAEKLDRTACQWGYDAPYAGFTEYSDVMAC